MIYDEELFCYPFLISQVGTMQNVFILSPEFLLRSKDEFSSLLYAEVENKHIRNSFFRMVKYGCFVIFIHYWATTRAELNTGRRGLFVISGVLFRANDLKKNWKHICYFIRLIYNTVQKLNDNRVEIINGQIIFKTDIFEDCLQASESTDGFQDGYCDNFWDMIQENDKCIGRYIFAEYQESYQNYFAENKTICPFFMFRNIVIFEKFCGLRLCILQKLNNRYVCKYKQKRLFKHNNQLPRSHDKNCFWVGIMILIEGYSTEKSLNVFLKETYHRFRKNSFSFDISTVEGLTPYTALFIRSMEQIPFDANKIKICKFNDVRYIKFFL